MFSVKGHGINPLGFASPKVSVATSQLYCYNERAGVDSTIGQVCIPIKLCLQKQARAGFGLQAMVPRPCYHINKKCTVMIVFY